MDSIFHYPINKIVQLTTISNESDQMIPQKNSNMVTREQLAEYIKKNSNKTINNQTVPVEDIAGQVAGVEE